MTWSLYNLASPLDSKVYKVGITEDIRKTLIQHLQSDDENMLEIHRQGQLPRLNVLRRTESKSEAERFLKEEMEKSK